MNHSVFFINLHFTRRTSAVKQELFSVRESYGFFFLHERVKKAMIFTLIISGTQWTW